LEYGISGRQKKALQIIFNFLMPSQVIAAEQISKQFIIGHEAVERYSTLREEVSKKTKKLFSFPGRMNSMYATPAKEVFFALRDISFGVEQGERLGIIGRNGAGKSTLLKILSRITEPSSGRIKIRGRVASLLEVGTGFHPELSGRENIFLNGAILGMSRVEIRKKFDEIVDFAEVEKFLDTPVKRYSSGMYVRLAFAVAAHLEPEILIVDEVLAVGDAQFQKKCISKMEDVSANDGRTVLFVSHNLAAIRTLCTKGLLLRGGRLQVTGSVNEAIDEYLKKGEREHGGHYINKLPKADSDILEIIVENKFQQATEIFAFDEEIKLSFRLVLAEKHLDSVLGIRVRDQLERNVFSSQIEVKQLAHTSGEFIFKCTIPSSVLVPNRYELVVGLHKINVELIQYLEAPVQFTIEETGTYFSQYIGNDYGCEFVDCKWE
jgi:lipopolysaccharide transport system ATP-binding protein